MEHSIRFRNHISVVLEQLGAMSGVIFVLCLTNVDEVIGFLENGTTEDVNMTALIGGGIVFGILVLTCLYQLVIWAKTYISICDNSIVIEKNTINKKKNTIGIKNISNVNTEQNLFEMLMGTCKVKLDTNSLSTAEQTDVKIVLKKADAEQFRSYLMKLMRQSKGETVTQEEESGEELWDYEAEFGDILAHGFLSINIFSVLVAIGTLVGVVGMISMAIEKLSIGESILGMILSFVLAVIMCMTAIRDILKGFIRYYGFKIARRGDKLYIRYGLFKKVNYTIPVEKINGLILRQSLTARIAGRYMAEIINIGMGDDEAEAEAFLFPYCKKDVIHIRMKEFLPELEETIQMEYHRQTMKTWIAWLCPIAMYMLFIGTGTIIALAYSSEYKIWIAAGSGLFSLWCLMLLVLYYITAGSTFGEEYIMSVSGFFVKRYCFVSYKKIQYVELKQNPLAKCMKIQKGEIYLLASAKNRVQNLPYFSEEDGEIIKEKILKR